MKWELDDNARSGFHYLFLGVLVVGLPSLLFWVVDIWHTSKVNSGELPLGVFHNGYLIFSGDTTAVADTSRGERIAYACAIAISMATVVIIALLPFRSASKWRVGRGVFIAVFVWGLISALFLPRTSVTILSGGIRVSQRVSLPGDITIPFTGRTVESDWQPSDELLGSSLPAPNISCAFRMAAYRVRAGDTLLLATTDARRGYYGYAGLSRSPATRALDHMDSLLFRR